eukprot:4614385-Amphidinium_carterae.1
MSCFQPLLKTLPRATNNGLHDFGQKHHPLANALYRAHVGVYVCGTSISMGGILVPALQLGLNTTSINRVK